jgi:hypothetical protein
MPVGGPLAAHQAIHTALTSLDYMSAGDLLGLAIGVIHHQRPNSAPSRLLRVEEIPCRHLAHQIVDNIVDELALAL